MTVVGKKDFHFNVLSQLVCWTFQFCFNKLKMFTFSSFYRNAICIIKNRCCLLAVLGDLRKLAFYDFFMHFKVSALSSFICNLIIIKIVNFAQVYNFCPNFHMCF